MNESLDDFEARLRKLTPVDLSEETRSALERTPELSRDLDEPSTHAESSNTRISVRGLFVLAGSSLAAACVLVVWFGQPGQKLNRAWALEASDQAEYRIVDPLSVELMRGELKFSSGDEISRSSSRPPRVESTVSPDSPRLKVQTPHGVIEATRGTFLVGTHRAAGAPRSEIPKGDAMNTSISRILVLSGTLLIANEFGSLTANERDLVTVKPGQAAVKELVRTQSRFGLDLYREISGDRSGNFFYSPFSVGMALSMLAEGARGNTALELGTIMHFPKAARRVGNDAQRIPWETAKIHAGWKGLSESLRSQDSPEVARIREEIEKLQTELESIRKEVLKQSGNGFREARKREHAKVEQLNQLLSRVDQYELRIANGLWLDTSFRPNPSYVGRLSDHYGSRVEALDIRGDREGSARTINSWASEITRGLISRVVTARDLGPQTRAVLTNAIYFNGQWQVPFSARLTKPRDFTLSTGTVVKVPMMWNSHLKNHARYLAIQDDGSTFETPKMVERGTGDEVGYPQTGGHLLIDLPYKGDGLSMLIIAPRRIDGMERLERLLTQENLDRWSKNLESRTVKVALPRFEVESMFQLKDALMDLGLQDVFSLAESDLSGIALSPSERLFVGEVIHKAVVKVSEEGTQAAAVTAMPVPTSAAPDRRKLVPFIPEFRADRPFVFLIRDQRSGAVLFVGRVMDPR